MSQYSVFISYARHDQSRFIGALVDRLLKNQTFEILEDRADTDASRGDGKSRFFAPLMDCLTARGFRKDEMVEALQDRAYKEVYGCNVPLDVRRVLRCMIRLQEECKSHPTAEKLNERVRIANRVASRSTARTDIKRAVDCGLISEEEDGRETFYFLSANGLDKATKLRHLLDATPNRLTPTEGGRPS